MLLALKRVHHRCAGAGAFALNPKALRRELFQTMLLRRGPPLHQTAAGRRKTKVEIWGRISSINVRKVVWCAQELGLAFDRVDAGRDFGVVQTPSYRALNPNGLVPTIEDDAGDERVVLWESNVVVRYLCARHASGTLY